MVKKGQQGGGREGEVNDGERGRMEQAVKLLCLNKGIPLERRR